MIAELHLSEAALDEIAEACRCGEAVDIDPHLDDCRDCRSRLAQLPGGSLALFGESAIQDLAVEMSPSLDVVSLLDRMGLTREQLESEDHGVPALLDELWETSQDHRGLRIANAPRFHVWPLAERLLDLSRGCWTDEPTRAEECARLALTVTDHLPAGGFRAALNEDLRARAWAYIGNSLRVRSELRAAREAFVESHFHLDLGSSDPLERATVLDLEASLCRDCLEFEAARDLMDDAASLYHSVGDRHLVGRALVSQALIYRNIGELDMAIERLEEAVELIDFSRDPRLEMSRQMNLGNCLFEAGRKEEALHHIQGARKLAEKFGTRVDGLRILWSEGRILRDSGLLVHAEKAFYEVREGFIGEEIAFDAALVSLDLASLYLELGRTAEVKGMVGEILPIFASRDIHREALAALLVLRQAVEQETASVRLITELVSYLERMRDQPDLRADQGL